MPDKNYYGCVGMGTMLINVTYEPRPIFYPKILKSAKPF